MKQSLLSITYIKCFEVKPQHDSQFDSKSYQILLGLRFLFLNLKTIRPHVRGHVSWIRCSKFFFISQVRPKTGLSNMNIIFLLNFFYYLTHLQFKFDLIQKIAWNAIN
jgi:hypothetical protein